MHKEVIEYGMSRFYTFKFRKICDILDIMKTKLYNCKEEITLGLEKHTSVM